MTKSVFSFVFSCVVLFSLTAVQSHVQTGTRVTFSSDDDLFELKKNFEVFGALYEEIVMNYVDHVRPQPFMKTAIDAMLGELDPYTRYYDQADNIDMAQMRRGPQATVGLNIGMNSGRLTVLAPETLTSGYLQGVQVGDRILQVDGVDVSRITVRDFVVLIRGEEGTTVQLVCERSGQSEPLTFLLKREVPKTTNVSYSGYLNGDSTLAVGYVRLDGFGNRAAREVRRAFRTMLNSAGLKAAVLDLRNNPGGLVTEAVELVGLFVEKGTRVVSVQGRSEEATRQYVTERDPLLAEIPLVILVNRFSASSSEIVSGALQDLDRAVIIGETTFGKGLVQIGRKLPYNTSMRITVGHYFTPQGRDIQSRRITSNSADISKPEVEQYRTVSGRPVRSAVGIEPDIALDFPDPGELLQALRRDGAFFQFAGEWIDSELAGNSDTELIASFKRWLRDRTFAYESEAGQKLGAVERAIPEHWDSEILALMDQVRLAIDQEKEAEYVRLESTLIRELKTEIRARTLDQIAQIQYELDTDSATEKALELVLDLDRYHSILTN